MTAPDNPLIDAARGRDAKQPEALRLADALDCEGHAGMSKAAKELRRQHARIVELEVQFVLPSRAAMGVSNSAEFDGVKSTAPVELPEPDCVVRAGVYGCFNDELNHAMPEGEHLYTADTVRALLKGG